MFEFPKVVTSRSVCWRRQSISATFVVIVRLIEGSSSKAGVSYFSNRYSVDPSVDSCEWFSSVFFGSICRILHGP